MISSEIHINFNADSHGLHTDSRGLPQCKNLRVSALDLHKSAFKICFLLIIIMILSSCAIHHTHFMDTLNLQRIKDGTYIGQDTVGVPPCSVKLATTVKGGEITDIKILSHYVTYPLAGRAYDIIPKRIIEKQSLDVDAVTAATVSTNNIKKAVLDALKKGEAG